MVEGALQRRSAAGRAASPCAAAPARPWRRDLLVRLDTLRAGGFLADALGLGFGCFQLGGDQRIVLGAQVDLVRIVAYGGSVRGLLLADQLVLVLELLDVLDAHPKLVGDPRVGSTLAHQVRI
jgi:hypothetical protein